MDEKQRYDSYAGEFNRRFDELLNWAINNWPNPRFPLMESDFAACRREIGEILGPKLGDPQSASHPSYGSGSGEPQYNNVTPAPWP